MTYAFFVMVSLLLQFLKRILTIKNWSFVPLCPLFLWEQYLTFQMVIQLSLSIAVNIFLIKPMYMLLTSFHSSLSFMITTFIQMVSQSGVLSLGITVQLFFHVKMKTFLSSILAVHLVWEPFSFSLIVTVFFFQIISSYSDVFYFFTTLSFLLASPISHTRNLTLP